MTAPVLQIRDLTATIPVLGGQKDVLHGISLHINAGERVALVGESGSGKSVTARIAMGLLQEDLKLGLTGDVDVAGHRLGSNARALRQMRGRELAMIFQDPMETLNPVFRIGDEFREVLRRREPRIRRARAMELARAALRDVELNDPEMVLGSYPFQLSGGMNQRVMIALALINRPTLLFADEPGTALDVSVQARTLTLMRELGARNDTAILFISHNLGVVREFADRVYVIYRGRIVEHGRTDQVFANPGHAYTRALLSALPSIAHGDLPDLPETSDAFLDPLYLHEGCAEPGETPR